jgi:hypothetical protein
LSEPLSGSGYPIGIAASAESNVIAAAAGADDAGAADAAGASDGALDELAGVPPDEPPQAEANSAREAIPTPNAIFFMDFLSMG